MGIIGGNVGCGDGGVGGCWALGIRGLFKNERGIGRGGDASCKGAAIVEVDGEMDGGESDFGLG